MRSGVVGLDSLKYFRINKTLKRFVHIADHRTGLKYFRINKTLKPVLDPGVEYELFEILPN